MKERANQKPPAHTPKAKPSKLARLEAPSEAKPPKSQATAKPPVGKASSAGQAAEAPTSTKGRKGRGLPNDLVLFRPSICGPTGEVNARIELRAYAEFQGKTVRVHVSTLHKDRWGASFVKDTEELAKLITAGNMTKAKILEKRAAMHRA